MAIQEIRVSSIDRDVKGKEVAGEARRNTIANYDTFWYSISDDHL